MRQLLNVPEAANYLRMAPQTLAKMRCEGTSPPFIKVGRRVLYDVAEIDSGCCGMAGSFGFEKEHYDLSVTIGNQRLVPAIQASAADVEIVAPGISCRQQIDHLAGRKAKHPAELM